MSTTADLRAQVAHHQRRIAEQEAELARCQSAVTPPTPADADFRFVVENLKLVVFQTDAGGRWLYLNPAWTEITGFEVAASLGQIFLDYVHPDDRQRNLELFQPLIAREKDHCRHEIRYRHADGGFRWIEVWARLTVDEQDQATGTTGTLTDITHRKQLEIALRQSEQNFHTFFDTLDHLLFVLDDHGRMLHVNATVSRRLGYASDELLGQSVLMVHPPERQAEAAQIVAAMLAGQAEYCPVPVQTKDGRQIPVETRVTLGVWNGRPAIFGVTKDLSALKASEELFTKAFQASPSLMALSEIDTGRYLDVNAAFLSALGYDRADAIGHTTLELQLFADPAQRIAALQVMQQQGYLRDYEVDVRARSGEIRYGLFSAEFITLQDRQILLTVMNDITERRQLEAALREQAAFRQKVIDRATEGLCVCHASPESPYLIFTVWNDRMREITGYTLDEINQLGWYQTVYPDPATQHRAAERMAQMRLGQDLHAEEWVITRQDGAARILLISTAVLDPAEEPVQVLALMQDITDRTLAEFALRDSEERYRTLAEASPDAIFIIDRHDRVEYVNAGAAQQLGRTPAELIGLPRAVLFPPGVADTQLSDLRQAFNSDEVRMIDHAIRYGEREASLSTWLIPLHDASGGVRAVMGVSRDLTTSRAAERALKISEADLNRAQAVAQIGSWRLDIDHDRLTWSPETYRMFGVPFGTPLTAQEFFNYVLPDDRPAVELAWEAALAGAPYDVEHRIVVQGEVRWVRERAEIERAPDGRALLSIGTVQDITAQRALLERLHESEARYRLIAEYASEWVFWQNPAGQFVYSSPACLTLTGHSADEFLADPTLLDRLIHPDDLARWQAHQLHALTDLAADTLEFRLQLPDGEVRWVAHSCRPVFDDQGRYAGARSSNRDVTIRRRLEDHYRSLFENAPMMYAITRAEPIGPVVEDCNEQFARSLGYTRVEVLERPLADFYSPALRPLLAQSYQHSLREPLQAIERELLTRDQRVLSVLLSTHPRFDAAGHAIGTHALYVDVSDRVRAEAALRESQSLYHSLVESSPLNICRKDLAGRFLFANHHFLEETHITLEDLLGKTDYDIHPSAQAEKYRLDDRRVVDTGQVLELIEERTTLDGATLTVQSIKTPIWDGTGHISGVQTSFWDITARKRAEDALRLSELKYHRLFSEMLNGAALHAAICDETGRLIDYLTLEVNHAFETLIGVTRAEVVNRRASELLPAGELAQWLAIFEPVVRTGQSASYEVYSSSNQRYFAGSAYCPEPGRFAVTFTDVTERVQAEAALRWSQSLLEMMANSSPLAFFVVDNRTDDILYFNQRFCEIWNIEHLAERMRRRELKNNDIIPDCLPVVLDVPAFAASCKPLQDEANRVVVEDEIAFTGGRTIRRFSTQIRGAHDEYFGRFYIFEDVTLQKQAESALRDLNSQLEGRVAERTAALTEANLHLTELDRLKDEFINRISHELRTPLTSIISYLELLTYGKPEKHDRYLQVLHTQTGVFRKLIEDLLDVSRLQLDNDEVRVSDFDLAIFMGNLISLRRTLIEQRQIHLELDLDAALDTLTTDAVLLRQALVNILTNALTYTPEGGRVTLSARTHWSAEQAWVTLAVQDTGPGISAQDLPHIFEPFYRGTASNDYKTPGTGVGLTIARHFVTRLGGRITVESEPGQGTTFSVWLPQSAKG